MYIDADDNTPEKGLTIEYQPNAQQPIVRKMLDSTIDTLNVEFLDDRTHRWYHASEAATIAPTVVRITMLPGEHHTAPPILSVPMIFRSPTPDGWWPDESRAAESRCSPRSGSSSRSRRSRCSSASRRSERRTLGILASERGQQRALALGALALRPGQARVGASRRAVEQQRGHCAPCARAIRGSMSTRSTRGRCRSTACRSASKRTTSAKS